MRGQSPRSASLKPAGGGARVIGTGCFEHLPGARKPCFDLLIRHVDLECVEATPPASYRGELFYCADTTKRHFPDGGL